MSWSSGQLICFLDTEKKKKEKKKKKRINKKNKNKKTRMTASVLKQDPYSWTVQKNAVYYYHYSFRFDLIFTFYVLGIWLAETWKCRGIDQSQTHTHVDRMGKPLSLYRVQFDRLVTAITWLVVRLAGSISNRSFCLWSSPFKVPLNQILKYT